jgi:predicted ester cyclase
MGTVEENKSKQRRVFDEALNKGNMAVVDELIDTNYLSESPQGIVKGPEGMKQGWINLRAAFPDIHFTIEDMIAEGDKVVSRITCKGTHKGEFMGIPPTGKKITIGGIIITHWIDGKEVETWEVIDMLGMMQQLEILPTIKEAIQENKEYHNLE